MSTARSWRVAPNRRRARREHRGTVDEILEEAGRQAIDVRGDAEVETGDPDHDCSARTATEIRRKLLCCSTIATPRTRPPMHWRTPGAIRSRRRIRSSRGRTATARSFPQSRPAQRKRPTGPTRCPGTAPSGSPQEGTRGPRRPPVLRRAPCRPDFEWSTARRTGCLSGRPRRQDRPRPTRTQ